MLFHCFALSAHCSLLRQCIFQRKAIHHCHHSVAYAASAMHAPLEFHVVATIAHILVSASHYNIGEFEPAEDHPYYHNGAIGSICHMIWGKTGINERRWNNNNNNKNSTHRFMAVQLNRIIPYCECMRTATTTTETENQTLWDFVHNNRMAWHMASKIAISLLEVDRRTTITPMNHRCV